MMDLSLLKRLLLPLLLLLLVPSGSALAQMGMEDELLPPEQAFAFDAYMADADTVVAEWVIADGYYLYGEQFRFESQTDGIELGEPRRPAGTTKEDEFFGQVETYRDRIRVQIPLTRTDDAPDTLDLQARSQGCADIGVCYPPQFQTASLDLNDLRGAVEDDATTTNAPPAGPISEQDRVAGQLADGRVWLVALAFFGFGLLLTFTPCVFPMIPILSNIILGQKDLTTRKAFLISLVFVLAMALTYTVAGVIAGLAGANLQAAFQNPWIIGGFVAIFIALALSMFGFFELQMPASIQTRLSAVSNQQQGGTLVGAGIMGFLSALIVGPCVTAPLVGALLYISQTGDTFLGGLALFSLSMGMGLPLLILGTSAGKLLPRAGAWMDTVKAVFGVLLLGMGIWLLERVMPAQVTMLLWSALLIVSAVYMGALTSLPDAARGWRALWKGLGLVILVYGVILMIGAASGGKDVLRPLSGLALSGGSAASEQASLSFRPVESLSDLERELEAARESGQPVVLDFYADWCVDCVRMERTTFQAPDVVAALSGARLLKADVTGNTPEHRELMRHFELFGPPAMIFFNAEGEERRAYRMMGYKAAEPFLEHVNLAFERG
ncbi:MULTISPECIES: protein-disulfide reductase DsbD [unclassified Ectothiorhodospira]|uniref:protein-disulfide reductase DsbD n=1 Tax=unclassified Ectothiorhodospira TaxID=2684909 RepID=UPI001EE8F6D6|nr:MULTISPECIES: protein-disulfide reductase DsbD [unclassified Ectothiorhodospira]MCG5515148.1 protein-disulfide reductase DsbD [Ectothiorhodospira sp. 9100]MCG5519665.1 protein-disulfide reductase DsbD [Ectothiorhodospira sp. 9905]